jgi:hypothetical protein
MSDADRRAHAMAARQFGALSRYQALDAGWSDRAIGRRISSGQLIERLPRSYVVLGAAPCWHQDL